MELRKKGITTIELLVAFVVLTVSISAVVMIIFGNQTFALDSKVSQQALYHLEEGIEEAYARSRANFADLDDFNMTLPDSEDDVFGNNLTVDIIEISDCAKIAKSKISWDLSPVRHRDQFVSSVFVSTSSAASLGGDCDTTAFSSDWDNPVAPNGLDVGGASATDIEVLDGYAYLVTAPNSAGKPDFFVVDVSDPLNPAFLSSLNTPSKKNYAVDVASGYAYIASSLDGSSTGQFQIVDVSVPATPILVATSSLPTVGGSFPDGVAINYHENKVYVGTHRTAGREFHIFDVSSPASPSHLGLIELNHNVNDIVVKGDLAYLASSDNNHELMIIDISNPASLTHPDITQLSDPVPGSEDGTSLFVLGNKVYLGRKRASSEPDFLILDVSDKTAPYDIPILGSINLGMNPSTASVEGVFVKAGYAFLATTHSNQEIKIFNILDPANIQTTSSCAESFNYPQTPTSLDVDGEHVFVSNSSNDALRIVFNSSTACMP